MVTVDDRAMATGSAMAMANKRRRITRWAARLYATGVREMCTTALKRREAREV